MSDKHKIALTSDISGAGTAAVQNMSQDAGDVPSLQYSNGWSGSQTFGLPAGGQFAVTEGYCSLDTLVQISIGTATIAGDAIVAPPRSALQLRGEGNATDNLSTITPPAIGFGGSGSVLTLFRSPSATEVITIKHGVGNIQCGADFVLNSMYDCITLMYAANGKWCCIAKQDNS